MSQAVNVNPRLTALIAAGTSPWLDQIRRSLTRGGELRRMIEEDCLRGMTSNPAIFEKAILGSPDYDEQIEELARGGALARAIYQEIAIQDVQEAADVLRSVFDDLDGDDGYVSLEVDPDLAFDTDRTIAQAREYWSRVDRPNVMIKIPGTPDCLPAIEQAIYEGININVTLLFAVDAYTDVTEAYIKGLERRRAEGKDLDVRSVASFFVSRVDSEVDKRLEEIGRSDLQGQAAVANARAAYRRFEEIFHGERFAGLLAAGAHVQRPLWASTGVKNPAYPETKYVEELVGPETVNTMPMQTLLACAERLEVQRRDGARGPDARARGARRGGHRHGRGHRQAPARGHRRLRHADGEAAGRHRGQARGDLHRPPGDDRLLAARRAGAAHRRLRPARRRRARRAPHLGQGRHALGPGRPARGRRPARLAERPRDLRRADRRPRGLRPRGRGGGLHGHGPAGDGRLEPRARGAAALVRPGAARAPAAARARLDRPRRGARAGARGRPRAHAVSRVDEVGRHDRDALAVRAFLEPAPARRAVRRDHRPRLVAGGARRRARLPAHVPQRPRRRRALQRADVLRARARRADGRRPRFAAGGRGRRRRGVLGRARRPRATAGCGSASRSARWRCRPATS